MWKTKGEYQAERASGCPAGAPIGRGALARGSAERARMSRAGVSALERGHRRTLQRETLALLAGRPGAERVATPAL